MCRQLSGMTPRTEGLVFQLVHICNTTWAVRGTGSNYTMSPVLLGHYRAGGPAYYVLHPQKGITICLFFKLPGLQKPGRNHFSKNSNWGITVLGILVSQNNLWTNSLIRVLKAIVHTFCFLLLVSYFNEMVICFNIW